MGDLLGGKPKVKEYKPSAESQELERRQLEERKEQESELSQRQAMKKKRAAGRSSLLTGAATGVDDKSSVLGA